MSTFITFIFLNNAIEDVSLKIENNFFFPQLKFQNQYLLCIEISWSVYFFQIYCITNSLNLQMFAHH